MRGVIARPSRRLEKIRVRFFALKIFHPPRAPERFQLFFRKFGSHVRPATSLKSCAGKSSQHFELLWRASSAFWGAHAPRIPEIFLLIERTLHSDSRLVQDVSVNHRRAHIFVA